MVFVLLYTALPSQTLLIIAEALSLSVSLKLKYNQLFKNLGSSQLIILSLLGTGIQAMYNIFKGNHTFFCPKRTF